MPWPIEIGRPRRVTYEKEQAELVLAGYAGGTALFEWQSPLTPPLGPPPPIVRRNGWAYRSFDCAPASPHGLSIWDITITAAIDSRIRSKAVLGMMAIADDVATVLTQIPLSQTFWSLPPADVGPSRPAPGTIAWQFWRAWELLAGVPFVGMAVAHKTLHHKRPWLFPMLDSVTSAAMGGGSSLWEVIHDDLVRYHSDEFGELEAWFANYLAIQIGGVQLTRLRIHDILLWADASGNREALTTAGKPVLGGRGGPQNAPGGVGE